MKIQGSAIETVSKVNREYDGNTGDQAISSHHLYSLFPEDSLLSADLTVAGKNLVPEETVPVTNRKKPKKAS